MFADMVQEVNEDQCMAGFLDGASRCGDLNAFLGNSRVLLSRFLLEVLTIVFSAIVR